MKINTRVRGVIELAAGLLFLGTVIWGYYDCLDSCYEMTCISNTLTGLLFLFSGVRSLLGKKSTPAWIWLCPVTMLTLVFGTCVVSLTGMFNMNFGGGFLFMHLINPPIAIAYYLILANPREDKTKLSVLLAPVPAVLYLLVDYIVGSIVGSFVYGFFPKEDLTIPVALLLGAGAYAVLLGIAAAFMAVGRIIHKKDKPAVSTAIISSVLAVAVMFFGFSGVGKRTAVPRSTDVITIMYTSDVHCAVSGGENCFGYEGLAEVKAGLQKLSNYVTLVDCGDAVSGSSIGTITEGESIIKIMNSVGYDICTVGNHEFDYGAEQLKKLVGLSTAEYICCNLTNLSDGSTVFAPSTMRDYDGIKVGYVGVTVTNDHSQISTKNLSDENENPLYDMASGEDGQKLYDTVQKAVDGLHEAGADYVVALAHLGEGDEFAPYGSNSLAAATNGIDVIINGHSHTVNEGEVITNKDGNDMLLTSSGTGLEYIGVVRINTNGTETKSDDVISARLIGAADKTAVETVISAEEAGFEDMLAGVVAKSDVTLTTLGENGNRAVRCRETNAGNFCADAYRSETGADIGLANGGGVRADIDVGDVTYGELLNMNPYSNSLCMASATGKEILDTLEIAYSKVETASEDENGSVGESGGFLQVSGLKLTIDTSVKSPVQINDEDSTATIGDGARRVSDVYVLDRESGEYLPLDTDKTYTVASSAYVIKYGGDGNAVLSDNEILLDETETDLQALINYATNTLGGTIGADYTEVGSRIIVK